MGTSIGLLINTAVRCRYTQLPELGRTLSPAFINVSVVNMIECFLYGTLA